MKHLKAMAVKFIACLVVLMVILGLVFNVAFSNILLITVVLGLVSYLLGDLFLLPRSSNNMATLADFGLSFVIIWAILANISNDGTSVFWATLISAIGVSLGEYFFHRYMQKRVLNQNDPDTTRRGAGLQFQTEASEEIAPEFKREDDNQNT